MSQKSYERLLITPLKIQFDLFDLLRFLLSFVVISIHTINDSDKIGVVKALQDISVPLFAMTTGFLCMNTCGYPCRENFDNIKKYELSIIKTYLIWTLLYIPLTIYGNVAIYKLGGGGTPL